MSDQVTLRASILAFCGQSCARIVTTILLVVGFGQMALAQSASLPEQLRALLPAARAEGEVRVFGMTLSPPQIRALSDAIAGFYGIPITLRMSGGSHVAKAAEMALAARSGAPTGFDVFWTANTPALIEAKLLKEIDWRRQTGDSNLNQDSDHRRGIASHHDDLTLVTYNKDMVKPADVPASYDVLVDPKWKGRIAVPRDPTPWAYLAAALGEKQADTLLQRYVAEMQPRILPRVPEVRAQVIAGQFPLGLGTDAFLEIRNGAPIEHAPISPVILSPQLVNILIDAKNTNAATLFGYWLVTPAGQQALSRITGRSLVGSEGTELHKFAQGKKIFFIDADFLSKDLPRLSARYADMLGIR